MKNKQIEFEAYGESLESHPDFLSLKADYEYQQIKEELNQLASQEEVDIIPQINLEKNLHSVNESFIFDTPIQENLTQEPLAEPTLSEDILDVVLENPAPKSIEEHKS